MKKWKLWGLTALIVIFAVLTEWVFPPVLDQHASGLIIFPRVITRNRPVVDGNIVIYDGVTGFYIEDSGYGFPIPAAALTEADPVFVAWVNGTTLAAGNGSAAGGTMSVAYGDSAAANGDNSVALGDNAAAGGVDSVAVGSSAAATADNTTALGAGASATAVGAIQMGAGVNNVADSMQVLGDVVLIDGNHNLCSDERVQAAMGESSYYPCPITMYLTNTPTTISTGMGKTEFCRWVLPEHWCTNGTMRIRVRVRPVTINTAAASYTVYLAIGADESTVFQPWINSAILTRSGGIDLEVISSAENAQRVYGFYDGQASGYQDGLTGDNSSDVNCRLSFTGTADNTWSVDGVTVEWWPKP